MSESRGDFELVDSDPEKDAVQRLLRALPSIASSWSEHLPEWEGEPAGSYNDVRVFSFHLRDRLPARPTRNHREDTSEFQAFFATVEQLFYSPSERVRELLTVGLLEGLQNITAAEHRSWTRFEPWLGPRTLKAWRAVIASGEGDIEALNEVISGRAFEH